MAASAAPGVAPAPARARARSVQRALRRAGAAVPEAAIVVLAGVLRLVALGRVPLDPYYDAAVRSMATGWAALLGGAFEPGGRVAIDKPPVDLWLQVLAVRAFGFGPVALHLPEALGGTALVVALMALLRTLLGRGAALAGGLALAVLPVAVVTARSDTMDAVMAALAVAAAALIARAARRESVRLLAPAGVLLGLAFDVKLAEALLPVLAAGALWVLAGPPGRRARGLAIGATAFLVTAAAWLVAVAVVPLHPRPWALGSSSGAPWQAALIYNGIDRLVPGRVATAAAGAATAPRRPGHGTARDAAAVARHHHDHVLALARRPGAAGPLRLLSSRAHLDTWIGIEAVAALAALAAALALGRPRGLDRVARGGLVALALWLLGGLALSSGMPDLRPRYLACVEPAVAGALGAGLAVAVRGRGRAAWAVAAAALLAVLAVPAAVSVHAVAHATQDSGRPGAVSSARVAALSRYVGARDRGTGDELAASAPAKAAQLIARDGRPVLILSDGNGRQLVTPARLAAAVAAGRVRFAWIGDACTAGSGNARTGCLPVMRWARSHGTDVSRAAGQPHRGALYELSLRRSPAAGRAASGRTARSATSPRTARAAAASGARPASRAPGGRAARARRASRSRSGARRARARRRRARCAAPGRGSRRCSATAAATA
jgi:4-amino-4-deoxy-L-arabinose transferase-like glycosyltransferase